MYNVQYMSKAYFWQKHESLRGETGKEGECIFTGKLLLEECMRKGMRMRDGEMDSIVLCRFGEETGLRLEP